MDDSQNRQKVVEYWSHAVSVGGTLFNNLPSDFDGLQLFVSAIVSTKLLHEIECLSEENEDVAYPFPMTGWLLENMFNVYLTAEENSESYDFLVDAQIKLLEATYDRNVCDYLQLCKMYIDLLDKFQEAKLHTPLFMFNKTHRPVLNAIIPPVSIAVRSERHRFRCLATVLEVLNGNCEVFFNCCAPNDSVYLIRKLMKCIEIGDTGINVMLLPVLKTAVKSIDDEGSQSNEIFRDILILMTTTNLSEQLGRVENREDFLDLRRILRDRAELTPFYTKGLIDKLMKIRTAGVIDDFIVKEFGILLASLPPDQQKKLLRTCRTWSLYDKICALEPLVVKEVQDYLKTDAVKDSKGKLPGETAIQMHKNRKISYWTELYPGVVETAEHGLVAYGRIKIIHAALSMITRLLAVVDHHLVAMEENFSFFGDSLSVILQCIMAHFETTSENAQLAVDALVILFNLPESTTLPQETLSGPVLFVAKVISGKVAVSGVSKEKFLQVVQNVPLPLLPDDLLGLFTAVKSKMHTEPALAMQVIECGPHLCLSGKISCAQVIAEVLMPYMLSDVEAFQMKVLESVSLIMRVASGTAHATWNSAGRITIKYDLTKNKQDCGLIENHILRIIDPSFGAESSVRLKLLEVLPYLSRHLGAALMKSNVTQKLISLLGDEDIAVRQKFAELAPIVLFGQTSIEEKVVTSDYQPLLEFFLKKVQEELSTLSKEVWSEQLHCLTDTIMKVACVPVDDVVLPCLKLLIALSLHCPMPMSVLTCQLAAAHNTSSVMLYHTYRPELSQFFGQLIVENYERYQTPVSVMLDNWGGFFNEMIKMRLLASSEPYILSILCASAAHKSNTKLITDYANYVEQSVASIIMRCFQHIYVHLYFHESENVFNNGMKLLHNLLSLQEPALVNQNLKSIIHQLLFNYHLDAGKALKALENVLEVPSFSNCKDGVASNLECRFVGYLLFIVRNFTKDGTAESDRVQSLQSLAAVLGLMGIRRITPVARKVLEILQSTLDPTKHCELQCKAWHAFVVNVNSRALAPLLGTIVVSLLPMLERAEAAVVGLLTYLLVEQRAAMEGYLQNIIFLPQHPALTKINTIMSSYVSSPDLKSRLAKETELALHETVAVRVAGLKALSATLQKYPLEIVELINGCDTPDSSVVQLWNALLICCRDSDEEVATAAAACLGELGAVDPALLPRERKPPNKAPLTVHEPEFGFLALKEIVRGFQNARTSADSDAFALGIQEIFKIFDVRDDEENATWVRFTAADQSLMRPMFSSRYKVQAVLKTQWPPVIFGSQEASSHLRWAALWTSKLISQCVDDRAVALFRACEPSLKRDAKVLQFFLQYIVLHILTQDGTRHDEILTEMMAVLNRSTSEENTDGDEKLPLRLMERCGQPLIKASLSDADIRDSAMTVCLAIDFLQYWSRLYLTAHSKPGADHLNDKEYTLVKEYLDRINLKTMAEANFDMKEYPRAVQYWEEASRENEATLMKNLPKLSKAYARYGDLDSVAGARAMSPSTLNMSDRIFYHQVSRQWEEARILYEQLMSEGQMTPSQVEGLVTCYLRLGEPSTALGHIDRYNNKAPEMATILTEAKADSLLKLGDWTAIADFSKELEPDDRSWSIQLMRCFEINIECKSAEPIGGKLAEIRTEVCRNFAALGCHATAYNYDYASMVKLHILNEIQSISALIVQEEDVAMNFSRKLKQWDIKDKLLQTNSDFYEQILSARRSFLTTVGLANYAISPRILNMVNEAQGKFLVKSAETARRVGCLNQAYNYVICAERYNIPQTFIEKAQLLWQKGQKEESLLTLVRGIARFFPDAEMLKSMRSDERLEERKLMAQAKLLFAVYNEETSNCSPNINMMNYQDAHEACRLLEKNQVLLAQCLDRFLGMMDSADQDGTKACDLRVTIMSHFGKSLTRSCEYIYQSVPRMLSIWLDLGENLVSEERKAALKKCNKLIQSFSEILPPFIFMTALPQLLSRIAHPNREVFNILKSVIVKLIIAYPQQCLWAMQTLAKSAVPERRARYKETANDAALRSPAVHKLIEDFSTLGDKLNSLTNKNLPQDSVSKGMHVASVVRELPLLLESSTFSRIIIPVTKFCSIALPKNVTSTTHEPFIKDPASIVGIKKEMTVLNSLQKPRKITLLGSDGNNYDILCKPKDDLRRDARLMEFNNIVNMNLRRDPDSRARNLHIRTYVVTPLGECGGLLEWVPNLVGLRPALLKLYTERGKLTTTRELRKLECNVRDPLDKKREVFLEKLIPMHPPVFPEWFRKTFPDPAAWYLARQEYTRTTAVMSMVGYILGLGDRHGENILMDSESGDAVHVDFNCLFNKGEKFDWKERVPFRLTHNMAKAMGPCGVEGTFRKSCEISMRVLREQHMTLMSVLTPFAYDPFGSWSKTKDNAQNDKLIAEALAELTDIERRLKGSMRQNQKNITFYLSVEGLVRALIADATNVDNLCQMYLGWGAYL